ncbi:hypothetical protein [Georgenia sp. SUBG003]
MAGLHVSPRPHALLLLDGQRGWVVVRISAFANQNLDLVADL